MKANLAFSTIVALSFCLTAFNIAAQVHPIEGSKLNYRIVGFSFPKVNGASTYTVEVAKGNIDNEALFQHNIIKSAVTSTNKTIVEVPAFGEDYTWRIIANNNRKSQTELHHFSTLKSQNVDTGVYRFTIDKSAVKYKEAYVFNDGNSTLYDMNGKPVWFMPPIKGAVDEYSVLRDIKVTPHHTITFVSYNMVYEIDYDGHVLWQPRDDGRVSGDSSEHYHHEMTMLANGHYMTMGHNFQYWQWQWQPNGDSIAVITDKKGSLNRGGLPKIVQMGTVIEYDSKGNVVWSWKASDYFKGDKLAELQVPVMGFKDMHQNAFYFDEKKRNVYISFKNLNQVLKVSYPDGKVVAVYDGSQTERINGSDLYLFSEQHACKISSKGMLYLFNNNMANSYVLPKVLVIQMPESQGGKLKKVWEYEYPDPAGRAKRVPLTSGGNVIELPDESMFVSTCVPGAQVYIVAKNKQLLWAAQLQKWNQLEQRWKPFPQYRASIILSRKDLEKVIWASTR